MKPGTRPGDCGAGIKAGEGISFNVDYSSGDASLQGEMNDLAAQASRVGIHISLTTHSFEQVTVFNQVACPKKARTWTAENPGGAYFVYGPDFLPTGELLYNPGAPFDAESYSDPKATRLIQATITGPASRERPALTAYAQYITQQLPVIFGTNTDRHGQHRCRDPGLKETWRLRSQRVCPHKPRGLVPHQITGASELGARPP